ncbi:MAG: HTH-type transcriptional regulator CymR [Pseudomonadota bacterium]|jgi:Rrf2 family protein
MISRKVVKALEVAAFVAARSPGRPVTVKEMADALGLSVGYLEVLVRDLREHGLLVAHRGPGGGYQFNPALLREPAAVSVWDVISIYQGQDDSDIAVRESDSFSMVRTALHESFRLSCERIPLHDLVSSIQLEAPETSSAAGPFKLKPLTRPMLPCGFNSVFQWAAAA